MPCSAPYPEYPSLVLSPAAAPWRASVMTFGMGSVVSPIPREMIFASGFFSWWFLRRLPISGKR